MENISYTAHVSNKKSAITSKSKLTGVAKHNLRKYKSSDYSKDNIFIIYGTSNLIDDVKTVYHFYITVFFTPFQCGKNCCEYFKIFDFIRCVKSVSERLCPIYMYCVHIATYMRLIP